MHHALHEALRASIAVGAVALWVTLWTAALVYVADHVSRNER